MLAILFTVSETIREMGEVPNGVLWATLDGKANISFTSYQAMIEAMKRAKLVSETAHVLRWTGPAL